MPNFNEYMPGGSTLVNSSSETFSMVDRLSNQFPTIESDHWRVHNGNLYEVSVFKIMSADSTYDISLTTTSNGYIHIRNANVAASSGYLLIGLYEGTSASGGAPAIPMNHNRVSTASATGIVVTSATITALGTLLKLSYIVGQKGVAGTGGGNQLTESVEWVLAQNQTYNWRLTNEASASNTVVFNFYGYDIGAI